MDTKSSLIRLFLLNIIISFLNYIGEKNEFFNSKQFNDIKSLNKINNLNYNILYSKIFDIFLSIPIQIHFSRMTKIIFERRPLYIKDIRYKNYYLLDLSNDKIILSLESLHDKNNDKSPVLKTSDQKKLWEELIFHSHNLKNDYIKKNSMYFNKENYQNFFVKIEYKVTYPRRNFIIKFLPLFKGMCIIHEYIQLKLSTFEAEDKKSYNEKVIIYGYDEYDNIIRNSDNRYFENEHYLLKQVHLFIIESLFCSDYSISYFFSIARKPKIYFSGEILKIIDNEVNNYIKNSSDELLYNDQNYLNEIINKIKSVLYGEYEKINNNKKILQKSSNQFLKSKSRNDLILKEIQLIDKNKSIQITKNEALIILFNSIQFNKNIEPNDITLDLNDERISQLRITHTENNDISSLRITQSVNKMRNSINLSELLSERYSNRPSKESYKSQISMDKKFPFDTDEKERNNYIETNNKINSYSSSKNNLLIKNNNLKVNNYNNDIPEPLDTDVNNYDHEYSNNNIDIINNNIYNNDDENNYNEEFNEDNYNYINNKYAKKYSSQNILTKNFGEGEFEKNDN